MKVSLMVMATSVLLVGAALGIADDHATSATGGEEIGYFDVEKCTICKPFTEVEGMVEQVQWETHKLENGLVMTAYAPKAILDDYREACDKCHALAEEVMTGQTPGAKLCGFCKDFGTLAAAGAKMQEVKTGFGAITIITSDDPEVVEKIHAMADRTNKEMEKMAAAG